MEDQNSDSDSGLLLLFISLVVPNPGWIFEWFRDAYLIGLGSGPVNSILKTNPDICPSRSKNEPHSCLLTNSLLGQV